MISEHSDIHNNSICLYALHDRRNITYLHNNYMWNTNTSVYVQRYSVYCYPKYMMSMNPLQAKTDSAVLPSGRTDDETSDLRQLIFLIHKHRKQVLSGRSVDQLYAFGLGLANRERHTMSAMDRADMAHLLIELGWRVFAKKNQNGSARWVPPKPHAKNIKKRAPRRYRGRSRW